VPQNRGPEGGHYLALLGQGQARIHRQRDTAGGGGIGLMLQTFFGSLQYHKAGTVVAFIVLVVALMDFASAKLREQLV